MREDYFKKLPDAKYCEHTANPGVNGASDLVNGQISMNC